MNLEEKLKVAIGVIGVTKAEQEFKRLENGFKRVMSLNQKGMDKMSFRKDRVAPEVLGLEKKKQQQAFTGIKNRLEEEQKMLRVAEKARVKSGVRELELVDKKIKHKQKLNENYNNATIKESKRFKAENLSIMFAGMALQRAFGGLFKSMIKDYKEFTKESVTPLSKSLLGLEANWKFLKFAMIDAASPYLSTIADFFSGIAKGISKMNPTTLAILTGVIGTLAVVGTVATVYGQIALLFTSLASAAANKAGLLALKNAVLATNGLPTGAVISKATTFLTTLATVAGVGLVIYAAFKMVKDFKSKEVTDGKSALITALSGGLGVGLITMSPLLGLVATLTIATYYVVMNTLKEGIKQREELLAINMKAAEKGQGALTFDEIIQAPWQGQGTWVPEFAKMSTQLNEQFRINAIDPMTGQSTELWDTWGKEGDYVFSVTMKDSVKDFVTDDKSGLYYAQNEATLLNDALGKPISKTVTINYRTNDNDYFGRNASDVNMNMEN